MGYETSQISRWLAMADVTVKRSLRQQTVHAAEQGLCLKCGQPVGKTGRRGLCNQHYLRFHRKKIAKPKSARPAFEETQIRNGRILAAGQVREIRTPDDFPDED